MSAKNSGRRIAVPLLIALACGLAVLAAAPSASAATSGGTCNGAVDWNCTNYDAPACGLWAARSCIIGHEIPL